MTESPIERPKKADAYAFGGAKPYALRSPQRALHQAAEDLLQWEKKAPHTKGASGCQPSKRSNILSHAPSHAEAVEILANLEAIADFGITHWQYIGGKAMYRPEWAKGAFYKYTVRKRFNIHRGTPGNSISEIFEIIDGESLPEQIFEPSNWTLDLETAEKYVNFARGQRKMYQIVKLTRCENSQWLVDEQIAVSVSVI